LTVMAAVEFEVVDIDNPDPAKNLVFGQSHFIKTVDDIYEALVQSGTALKFGIAFCEASGKRLVRWDGNDEKLSEHARKIAEKVACGHTFWIVLDQGFPINVLNAIKTVPEVVRIYCATQNPLQVVVAKTSKGRGVSGVIDGEPPLGIENEKDQHERREFLKKIGYKR